jgi:hypothetical protein
VPHLDSLKKSLLDMTDDELLELTRQLRLNRTNKRSEKASAKNQRETKGKLSKLLSGMSPEDLQKLLGGLKR